MGTNYTYLKFRLHVQEEVIVIHLFCYEMNCPEARIFNAIFIQYLYISPPPPRKKETNPIMQRVCISNTLLVILLLAVYTAEYSLNKKKYYPKRYMNYFYPLT